MSTINRAFAFRPELTTGGSGGYVVPAGKFAWLSASAGAGSGGSYRTSITNGAQGTSSGGSGSGNGMWLAEGDVVDVSNTNASASTTSNNVSISSTSVARVRVNALNVCIAVSHTKAGTASEASHTAEISGATEACHGISQYDKKTQHIPE